MVLQRSRDIEWPDKFKKIRGEKTVNNKFGAKRNNLNSKLGEFAQILEWLIMNNPNGASKNTEGDSGLVIAIDAAWGGVPLDL